MSLRFDFAVRKEKEGRFSVVRTICVDYSKSTPCDVDLFTEGESIEEIFRNIGMLVDDYCIKHETSPRFVGIHFEIKGPLPIQN